MSESKIYTIPDGNNSLDPNLMLAMSQNGGFGNGMMWMWPMFLFFLFPWMFGGNGFGNGMFGGNGFLANQLNNDAGRDLLLQAINGRADALSQLAGILNTDISNVQNAVNTIQSSVQSVGAQVGLSGAQVINSVQSGNAALSQQLCECCCENRLAIVNQTNQLQSQAASNFAAQQLQLAENAANVRLQLAQNEASDQLSVCQQTNTLTNQSDRNTNSILNAINAQTIAMNDQFCQIKERELQSKIDTQSDIITQLRGQLDNDRQTAQLFAAINPLQAQVNNIAAKQPNTVPVEWPNLTAVNNTPYAGGFYGWGNGWNGSFWG